MIFRLLDLFTWGAPSDQSADVFCQYCGRDITDKGADISSTGKAYCHGVSRAIFNDIDPVGATLVNFAPVHSYKKP